ncbi:hypothetical protein IT568_00710 [bacterium]|nr:hypothetical protein [bacterium]
MEDFYKKLQSLKNESWFRGENVWLDYFFHFTDIENAVEILKEGKLYCRKEAVKKGLMKINNASEIERVILCDKWFKIDFNVGKKIEDCTFILKIKMLDRTSNLEKEKDVSLKISEIKSKKSETFPFEVDFKVALKSYELKLFLDNKLAFSGEYSEANLLPY